MTLARTLALLLLAWAGLPAPAGAQLLPGGLLPKKSPASAVPAPATPAKAEPPPPAAVPLPSLIRVAEESHRALRIITDRLADDSLLREVESRLPATAQELDRLGPAASPAALAGLSDRALVDLAQLLARTEQSLARWDARLEEGALRLHAASKELARMEATWRLTEESARAEQAPSEVMARIDALQSRIRALSRSVQERLAATLKVQDRVATERTRVADWMALTERTEKALEEQLFEIESVPLWTLAVRPAKSATLLAQLSRSASLHLGTLTAFASEEWPWLAALATLLGALAVALRAVSLRFRARAGEDPALRAPAEVLAHPVAAAALLALALAALTFPRAPVTVSEVLILCMLPAFGRAMGGVLPAGIRRSFHSFGALFMVDRLGALAPEYSLLSRLILLAVAAAALAGLLRALRGGTWSSGIASEPWRRALKGAGIAGAAMLAGSILANLVGNVGLARRLGSGTLAAGALAVLIGGVALVLQALWVGAIHLPQARRLGVVRRHGTLLAERGAKYLRWAAVVAWALAAGSVYRLGPFLEDGLGTVLGKRLRVGGLDVSIGDVAAFVVTLWISLLLARFLAFALEEGLEGKGLPRGVPAAISRTAQYVVVAVGFAFAALASGMELTRFTVLLGALSVGIGFGLQNVVNNFVSGLILLYERPVQMGDVVELGTLIGTVRRIGIRSSTLSTFQGAEVVVPNANLISGELVNWTLSDRKRRVDIDVGVAYGSDPERVREVLLQAVAGRPDVAAEPAPVALFTGFGDSALTFQLRFWTVRFDNWVVEASDVRISVSRALAEAGIEIPFPQRDLHLRSVDPAAARLLGGARQEEG
jgi:small-conductance mechanosensitive channel